MDDYDKDKSKLSVVFSFYNEEDVIPELVRRTTAVLDKECSEGIISEYELIFVNDQSTDNSENILKELSRTHRCIKILNMSRNFGVSPCVMAGLAYATGDAAVYMDADLQDPPEIIPQLIKHWKEGADVVHTKRIKRKKETLLKLFITRIGYLILNYCTEIKLPIETGDFKLVSRPVLDHLIKLNEKKPFMRGLITWIGFDQRFVTYEREGRHAGNTKFPILSKGVIMNFFTSALISFSAKPLIFIFLAGAILFIFSILIAVYFVIQYFCTATTPGWTSLIVVNLFIGGIQLMMIGILGLYVGTIYLEVKGRPNYIVKSTYGFDSEK